MADPTNQTTTGADDALTESLDESRLLRGENKELRNQLFHADLELKKLNEKVTQVQKLEEHIVMPWANSLVFNGLAHRLVDLLGPGMTPEEVAAVWVLVQYTKRQTVPLLQTAMAALQEMPAA